MIRTGLSLRDQYFAGQHALGEAVAEGVIEELRRIEEEAHPDAVAVVIQRIDAETPGAVE